MLPQNMLPHQLMSHVGVALRHRVPQLEKKHTEEHTGTAQTNTQNRQPSLRQTMNSYSAGMRCACHCVVQNTMQAAGHDKRSVALLRPAAWLQLKLAAGRHATQQTIEAALSTQSAASLPVLPMSAVAQVRKRTTWLKASHCLQAQQHHTHPACGTKRGLP